MVRVCGVVAFVLFFRHIPFLEAMFLFMRISNLRGPDPRDGDVAVGRSPIPTHLYAAIRAYTRWKVFSWRCARNLLLGHVFVRENGASERWKTRPNQGQSRPIKAGQGEIFFVRIRHLVQTLSPERAPAAASDHGQYSRVIMPNRASNYFTQATFGMARWGHARLDGQILEAPCPNSLCLCC